MSDDKEWLKAGIKIGMEYKGSPYATDLFKHGVDLGLVASITPGLADLSDANIDRVLKSWKTSKGIGV
jgi:hypothetical protein